MAAAPIDAPVTAGPLHPEDFIAVAQIPDITDQEDVIGELNKEAH